MGQKFTRNSLMISKVLDVENNFMFICPLTHVKVQKEF